MARVRKFPVPRIRYTKGIWSVYWRVKDRQYAVSTGLTDKKNHKDAAEVEASRLRLALAKEPPEFPDEYIAAGAVQRYLQDREQAEQGEDGELRSLMKRLQLQQEGQAQQKTEIGDTAIRR